MSDFNLPLRVDSGSNWIYDGAGKIVCYAYYERAETFVRAVNSEAEKDERIAGLEATIREYTDLLKKDPILTERPRHALIAEKDAEIERLKKVADDIVNNFENAVYDRNASIEEKDAKIARLRAALDECGKDLKFMLSLGTPSRTVCDRVLEAIKSAEEALKK